ncbi:MAG: hypothetical protein ACR2GU_07175 [Rubrobacteraceae bacterium]
MGEKRTRRCPGGGGREPLVYDAPAPEGRAAAPRASQTRAFRFGIHWFSILCFDAHHSDAFCFKASWSDILELNCFGSFQEALPHSTETTGSEEHKATHSAISSTRRRLDSRGTVRRGKIPYSRNHP